MPCPPCLFGGAEEAVGADGVSVGDVAQVEEEVEEEEEDAEEAAEGDGGEGVEEGVEEGAGGAVEGVVVEDEEKQTILKMATMSSLKEK